MEFVAWCLGFYLKGDKYMLEEKIYKDYVDALKSKDKHKGDFLSLIRAEIKNAAIVAKKDKLDDNEVLAVLKKQKKRLDDAKESFAASGRQAAIEELQKEVVILDSYLPKQLDDNELAKIVAQIISETGAASIKDMGKVIKEVLGKVGASCDSKKVSELVKAKLSS